jgi:hypothetical protein
MHGSTPERWLEAAEQLRSQRMEQDLAAEVEAANDRLERERAYAAAKARHDEMQAAIDAAVPELEAVIARLGEAAKQLLAAHSDNAHVRFGGIDEGGGYHSVYFHSVHGLVHETGHQGGQSPAVADRMWPATAREAVEQYAWHGRGHKNPRRVRNIAIWFERAVEQAAGLKRDEDDV